jgi:hypothetical protein
MTPDQFLNQEDLEQYNKGGCTHTLDGVSRYCKFKKLPGPWRCCSMHTKVNDYHIVPLLKGEYDTYDYHMRMIEMLFKEKPELVKAEENYATYITDFFSKKKEMKR